MHSSQISKTFNWKWFFTEHFGEKKKSIIRLRSSSQKHVFFFGLISFGALRFWLDLTKIRWQTGFS